MRAFGIGALVSLMAALAVAPATAKVYHSPKQKYSLKETKKYAVDGKRTGPNECRLPKVELALRPGQEAVENRRVSIDTKTCRAVYEKGTPPDSELRKNEPKPEKFADKLLRGGVGAAQVGTLAVGHESGVMESWFTDPVGIVVNRDRAGSEFDFNGSCARSRWNWVRRSQFKPTGWYLASANWQSDMGTRSCRVTSSDYARFGNFAFCTAAYAAAGIIGDPRVSAYHNRTVFRAYGNGAMRGSTNGYTSGALCKYLLSDNQRLHRFRPFYFR